MKQKKLWERAFEWWNNNRIVFAHATHALFVNTDYISASLENLGIFLARSVLPNMDSASEDEWDKMLAFLTEVRETRGLFNHSITIRPYLPPQ